MKTLGLTDNWDLVINHQGRFEWLNPPDKFSQDLKVILKTNFGEYMFEEDMGVRWFEIFDYPTKNNVKDGLKSALKQYRKGIIINNIEVKEKKEERKFEVYLDITIEDSREEIGFVVG